MEFTQTATLKRNTQKTRDVSSHRRAYLDTYARRRAGLPDTVPTPVESVINNQQTVVSESTQPVQMVQQPPAQPVVQTVHPTPVVVAVPTIAPNTVQNIDPVFMYTPKPQYDQQAVSAKNHANYIDQLLQSHHQRVNQAPQSIDTVSQPEFTENTEHLIDPEARTRMSANLDALYNGKPLTEHLAKNKTSASASHVRTIVASALACGMLSVAIFSFAGRYNPQPVVAQPIGSPVIEVEAPVNNAPTGTPIVSKEDNSPHANPSDPVRIIASSIRLNARVNGIGTTSDGLIAVPSSYTSVGWYNKGVTPGEVGPAVFVGHYTGGHGGVFDSLKDLNDGDLLTVKNGRSQVFTYKVTKKVEYARDQVPMTEIFKKGDSSRLEIITCSGKWQSSSYNNRLVVSAELVQ